MCADRGRGGRRRQFQRVRAQIAVAGHMPASAALLLAIAAALSAVVFAARAFGVMRRGAAPWYVWQTVTGVAGLVTVPQVRSVPFLRSTRAMVRLADGHGLRRASEGTSCAIQHDAFSLYQISRSH